MSEGEAEGESAEDIYIAQRGRSADLLASREGGNLAIWSLSLSFVVTFARLSESPVAKG